MTKRNDIHSPSSIQPEDYTFVAMEHIKIECFGDVKLLEMYRKQKQEHMKKTGGKMSEHEHSGVCHICGNSSCLYTVIFYHAKTNTYIRTGTNCADKLEMGDSNAFKTFRKACKEALAAKAGKAKAESLLNEHDLSLSWNLFQDIDDLRKAGDLDVLDRFPRCAFIIEDIVRKLINYGGLSDKQLKFLQSLQQQYVDREEIEKKRKEDKQKAEPVPQGRERFQGEVICTRFVDSDFGGSIKMMFRDDRGFTLWGTVPRSLCLLQIPDPRAGQTIDGLEYPEDLVNQRSLKRGDRIAFTARAERAKDDDKHGFYSRPSKAELLEVVSSEG